MSFVPAVAGTKPRWRSEDRGRVFIRGGGAKGRPSLKNLVLPVVFLTSCPCCPPLVLLVHRSSSALLSLFSFSLISFSPLRFHRSSSSLLFRSSVFSPRPMSVPPDVLPASPPLSCHCRLPHLSPLQRSRSGSFYRRRNRHPLHYIIAVFVGPSRIGDRISVVTASADLVACCGGDPW